MPGHLSQANALGFLAFVRLVAVYFKKRLPAFISQLNYETPHHLFNSLETTLSNDKKHEIWLQKIREIISERITSEEERLPTYTALWRHWMRTYWCCELWRSANKEDIYKNLPPPETSGWLKQPDGKYSIDWEDSDIQAQIEDTINFLTKGCSCKTGCKTRRCRCRRNERFCGPGCECMQCVNVLVETPPEIDDHDDENDDYDNEDDEDNDDAQISTTYSSSDEDVDEMHKLETEIISINHCELLYDQLDF